MEQQTTETATVTVLPQTETQLSPELALVVETMNQNIATLLTAQLAPIKESLALLQTDVKNTKLNITEIQGDVEWKEETE